MAKNNPYSRAKGLYRALALNYAENYCRQHDLSLEKLKTQRFETIADTMVFAQPTGVQPDGLRNDIATQPVPTLILKADPEGKLQIETTEHTRKYLSNPRRNRK